MHIIENCQENKSVKLAGESTKLNCTYCWCPAIKPIVRQRTIEQSRSSRNFAHAPCEFVLRNSAYFCIRKQQSFESERESNLRGSTVFWKKERFVLISTWVPIATKNLWGVRTILVLAIKIIEAMFPASASRTPKPASFQEAESGWCSITEVAIWWFKGKVEQLELRGIPSLWLQISQVLATFNPAETRQTRLVEVCHDGLNDWDIRRLDGGSH